MTGVCLRCGCILDDGELCKCYEVVWRFGGYPLKVVIDPSLPKNTIRFENEDDSIEVYVDETLDA